MKIMDILVRDAVVLNLDVGSKREALVEMSEALAKVEPQIEADRLSKLRGPRICSLTVAQSPKPERNACVPRRRRRSERRDRIERRAGTSWNRQRSCGQQELPPAVRGRRFGDGIEAAIIEEVNTQRDQREVVNRQTGHVAQACRVLRLFTSQ